jgi:molybdopterin biosynthesis enzyme
VLALIARRVSPVGAQIVAIEAAMNAILAQDVISPVLPPRSIALRDGIPVAASSIADAGPYAPVRLPKARPIDFGDPMPEGTDAVLPRDAAVWRGEHVEVVAGLAAGDGVLSQGEDGTPQMPLRRIGRRIRPIDVPLFMAAGLRHVTVRKPCIAVVSARVADNDFAAGRFQTLSRAIHDAGGVVSDSSVSLEVALANDHIDGVIGIGGTGSGERDSSVRTLARLGCVEAYGIAITPGETTAFGWIGARPVLLLPGRFDAMLAAWLLIGRYLVARLSGGDVDELPTVMPLKRKIASTIGMTELIPARCSEGMAEPLASGYLSLTSIAHSDGWISVPAESEGFAVGTMVAVNRWP